MKDAEGKIIFVNKKYKGRIHEPDEAGEEKTLIRFYDFPTIDAIVKDMIKQGIKKKLNILHITYVL